MINWYVGSYSGLPAWSLTVSGSSPFLLLHIPANLDNDNATSSGWITTRQTRQHAIAFRVPCPVLLQGFTTERFKTLKHKPVVVYRLGNNGKRNSTAQSQIDLPTNHIFHSTRWHHQSKQRQPTGSPVRGAKYIASASTASGRGNIKLSMEIGIETQPRA